MRTATPAFNAAMLLPETTIATVVTFTWGAGIPGTAPTDFTGLFKSITPQADITTDVPSQTRDITGYPARGAQMVLAGNFGDDPLKSAAWLFDSYSASSPLYGLDWTGAQGGTVVEVFQGLADLPGQTTAEVYPAFTGFVTNVQINRTTGEVTLTLIDNRVQLAVLPQIPAVVASGLPQIAPGLSSLWPLDYVLRANKFYSGPPPRTGCAWYMSGHGSVYPEISGLLSNWSGGWTVAGDVVFDEATFGSVVAPYGSEQTCDNCFLITPPASPVPFGTTGHSLYIEGAIYINGVFGAQSLSIELDATSDTVVVPSITSGVGTISIPSITWGTNSAIYNIAVSPGWHTVAFQFLRTGTTTGTINCWIDRVARTSFNATGLANNAAGVLTQVRMNSSAPLDTWQVTNETSPGGPVAFTPNAILDASLNKLTAVPAYTNTDAWSLIQDLMEAEFGIGGFDEGPLVAGGVQTFYFKNRHDAPTSSQLTLQSTLSLMDMQYEINEANRVQTLVAQAHPLSPVGPQMVYSQTGVVALPANSTTTLVVTTPNPVTFIPTLVNTPIPIGGLPGTSFNGYMANRRADGTGAAVTNLNGATLQLSATTVAVAMNNPNAYTVYLAPTAGFSTANGVLALFGYAVVETPATTTAAQTSGSTGSGVQVSESYASGLPSVTLTDNLWRQDIPTVQQLVIDELGDLLRPRAMVTNLVVVGDARLQLGDRVTLSDPGDLATSGGTVAGAVLNDDFIVISIHPTIDPSGFTQTLTLRAVALARQWVLGIAGKSELGTTTWI